MTQRPSRAPLDVLLVEDNPADIRLTQEALKGARVPMRLHVVCDGVQAMAFLRGRSGPVPGPPDLVLLDLNLPRKDGREVLREMKQDRTLEHIPVVVLTTSRAEQDLQQSYHLRANAVIIKPADLDRFFEAVRAIEVFWVETATLWRP
jgi:two-component system response regulator